MRVVLSLGQKNSNQQQQPSTSCTNPNVPSSPPHSHSNASANSSSPSSGEFEAFDGVSQGGQTPLKSHSTTPPATVRKPKREKASNEETNAKKKRTILHPDRDARSNGKPVEDQKQRSTHNFSVSSSTSSSSSPLPSKKPSSLPPPPARKRTHSPVTSNPPAKKKKSPPSSTPARLKSEHPPRKPKPAMTRGTPFEPTLYDEENRENREEPMTVRNEARCYDENDPAGYEGEEERRFQEVLKKRGLEMVEMEGDGNCLFRAVSYQIYGDDSMHMEVRRRCLDFMAKDEAHFSQFVPGESFRDYIRRKRFDGVHGNNPEIQAISELFNRPVEVFVPDNGAKPINIFHSDYKTSDLPLRLSYHDGNHYNAVIDPFTPTAGLGLGLPGLEPGLADKMQMKEAVEESDKLHDRIQVKKAIEESQNIDLKRAMMESEKFSVDNMYKQKALALSDLEATDFELEQAILASSLESYNNIEQTRKQPWSRDQRRTPRSNSPQNSSSYSRRSQSPPSSSSSHSRQSRSHSPPTSSSSNVASRSVASAAASSASSVHNNNNISNDYSTSSLETPQDEYPATVQELVMNGFELSRVLHAYDLIGDNFDDLLAFLMSSGN